jgi:hypothetical protein
MIQCFTPGQMHWAFKIWFNSPIPTIFVISLGLCCGLLWKSPIRDSLYSAIVLALTSLLLYMVMVNINSSFNPAYCWGDVWRARESKAVRAPSLNDTYFLNLAIAGAIYLVSLIVTATIKRAYVKARTSVSELGTGKMGL